MFLLPEQLRNNMMAYIQANPSPNVPVGDCMQLLSQLQNLKTFGKPAAVAAPAERDDGPMATPGSAKKKPSKKKAKKK
jgi:hypothetical protein